MQPPDFTSPIETDAVVIGAGPVGLFQVFQWGLQGFKAHVIDTLSHAGGQCAALYGDKLIYDIPATLACTGYELVERLVNQAAPFAPQWHWGEQVSHLTPQAASETTPDGRLFLQTTQGTQFLARTVFIAAGVGAFVPRPLKIAGLDAFEGSQVFYHPSPSLPTWAGQHIVVHGGDEAAIAQVLACALAPPEHRPASITLQYRRDVFNAPSAMLAEFNALRVSGQVEVAIGSITGIECHAGRLTGLSYLATDGSTQRTAVDYLLVRLGLSPQLGPLVDWGLAMERKQLPINPSTFETNIPGVYAVGDVVTYPGKRKLMVCGFHEATLAAFAAAEALSGHKIPLEYTSSSSRLQKYLGVDE